MRLNQPLLAAGLLFSLTTLNAEAALTPYTSAGENLVYSSISNITWTADANLLGTMISSQGYNTVISAIIAASPVIYDTPNYFDGSYNNYDNYSGEYALSVEDFSSSDFGLTNWFGAKAFANYLNSINYAGSNQWALPTVGANTQAGYNQTSSQFGQLVYDELGFDDGYNLQNLDNFSNVQAYWYWSGTESEFNSIYGSNPGFAWFLDFAGLGYQFVQEKNVQHYAWVISPGQLITAPVPDSVVPVPGAVWLFGTGLLGLLGLKRRARAG